MFILLGLVLLVDFAHTWSESCLDRWESSPTGSNLWQIILVGSTFGMYIVHVTLTTLLYIFFAGSECSLNTFFITANLVLSLLVTVSSVLPAVQEANPRSGLAQASMVSVYCTYLVSSAVANHDEKGATCNPITNGSSGARTGTVVMGAMFTFLAVAYSTTRVSTSSCVRLSSCSFELTALPPSLLLALALLPQAATQTQALSGKGTRTRPGAIRLSEPDESGGEVGLVTSQPSGRKETMRYQALLAAVEAGSLPASALEESDDEDDKSDDGAQGEDRDDEKTGTKYSYTWFHIIFIMASMYVAGLLTDWYVRARRTSTHLPPAPSITSRVHLPSTCLSARADTTTAHSLSSLCVRRRIVYTTSSSSSSSGAEDPTDVYIGRSEGAMWMRIVSSWLAVALYLWSLSVALQRRSPLTIACG